MTCRGIVLCLAAWVPLGAAAAGKAEKIALAGSGVGRVAVVDKATGRAEWSYDLPAGSECNTVAVTKEGNVLLSYKQGARLIDRATKQTLWDFAVPEGQEAQTARLVDGGRRVLVGVCAVPELRLVELDAQTGQKLSEVNYNLGIDKPHGQFRQVCKTAKGSYLVPVISKARVIELDAAGQKIGEWVVPPTPFSVKEIDGGKRLLVSTIGALVEVERANPEVVRIVAKGTVGADTLRFCTEAERLKDGRTVLANWQGYAPKAKDAQLIEWDTQGKVVYRFADTSVMRRVSGFYLFKE